MAPLDGQRLYVRIRLPMSTQEFLSTDEAAAYLGISRNTLFKRAEAGILTRHRFDIDRRRTYYDRAELDALRTLRAA